MEIVNETSLLLLAVEESKQAKTLMSSALPSLVTNQLFCDLHIFSNQSGFILIINQVFANT